MRERRAYTKFAGVASLDAVLARTGAAVLPEFGVGAIARKRIGWVPLSIASPSVGLPRFTGGSASAPLLSRSAQASLTLLPVELQSRPKRSSSRGFDPVGRPTQPLVRCQGNRQFPGWSLPSLANHALGAHCKTQIFCAASVVCSAAPREEWGEAEASSEFFGAELHSLELNRFQICL